MLIPVSVACVVASPPTAVIALGDTDAETIARVRAAEPNAISAEAMQRALIGTGDPRTPSVESLERMLDDARDREARFDTAGASELRAEIARAFSRSVRPSPDVRTVAARAAHDAVAAALAEEDEADALRAAVAAVRTFPDAQLEMTRHPPPVVALFERARSQLAAGPHGSLRVEVDVPGTIVASGSELGRIERVLELSLPTGSHRIWWVGDDGTTSLPHRVDVDETGAAVTIAAAFERRLDVEPVVTLRCDAECAAPLRLLGERLGAARIIGVRSKTSGVAVEVASGDAAPWPPDVTARPQFSPWYLLPLGGGQLAQDRPVFASVYAATQLGLLVWHLVAWKRHTDALDSSDFEREPTLRARRNLSAGLFYGAVVGGVAEALLVGWLTGE